MKNRSVIVASWILVLLSAMPAAQASQDWDRDPLLEIIDRPVPALKDGRRISLEEVENAILAACASARSNG